MSKEDLRASEGKTSTICYQDQTIDQVMDAVLIAEDNGWAVRHFVPLSNRGIVVVYERRVL